MFTRLRRFLAPGKLAVLGYHRIGLPDSTEWDPMLFAASPACLDRHITTLKKSHPILPLDEALAIASGRRRTKTTPVLLTFDDGYLDNFEAALPVLTAHSVSAVFFLVTSFLAQQCVPWWDQIAWMCRRAQRDDGADWIARYKRRDDPPDAFWAELESATQLSRPTGAHGLFLTATHARAMLAAGMSIGAHTCTHPVLAHLNAAEQNWEIAESKSLLEAQLGIPVHSFAYPVGSPDAFSPETMERVRACGYRAAFSFYGGVNVAGATNPFDLKRIPVYYGVPDSELLREW